MKPIPIRPTLAPALILDHREAKARVLCALNAEDPLIAARDALDTLTARNRELMSANSESIRAALADQVVILENVVCAYTVGAARARRIDERKALQGIALRASIILTQSLLALHRLNEDQRNGSALSA